MNLSEQQRRRIALLHEQAESLSKLISEREINTDTSLQIDVSASAIALIALVTADELTRRHPASEVLYYDDLARRVKELAFLCLDIQETDEEKEIRMLVQTVLKCAREIAESTGLSVEQPKEAPGTLALPSTTMEITSQALQVYLPETDSDDMRRAEIRALRELLASLITERDNLVNVVLRDIEAAYMREVGELEAEAYRAECDARFLKAKLELMQACLNREEPIRVEKIDAQLAKKLEEYQKEVEDYVRRVTEAAAYSKERAKQKTAKPNTENKQDGEISAAQGERPVETEEQELRRLYRKIVKAMHPDLHPDQDPETKALFKRAIVAYKEFDLQTLREIYLTLEGEYKADADDIEKEKNRLLVMIHKIREEIRAIKNRHPYTLKALLDDPVRLEAAKENQKKRIENAKRAAEVYQARIMEIMKRYE